MHKQREREMLRFFTLVAVLGLAGCGTETPPAPEASGETAATPAQANAEEDIRHFLLQEYPEAAPMRYALAWHDLDGDGTEEAIVHVVTPWLCGSGGCNTLVLAQAGPMWRKIGVISVSRTPVAVLDSATNGWKDITVSIGGGGGKSGTAVLKFDGESYPSNPTVPPAEMAEAQGTMLIAEEPELVELAAAEEPSGG
jgi:putative lipoprotein